MKTYAAKLAEYIITRCQNHGNPVSNLQLQKILYFLWIDFYKCKKQRLFEDKIVAWQWGPVVYDVYSKYHHHAADKIREEYEVSLDPKLREFLDERILKYANEEPFDLVRRSHLPDSPWAQVYEKNRLNEIPFEYIENYALRGA